MRVVVVVLVLVLVVEDNRDAADLLAEMLEMIGFSVRVAYTGQSGLGAVEQDPLDVVLLDIGLPDLDGYEVCRRIRRARLLRQPVVVALTGWGNDADRDRTAQVGFNAHLTPPPRTGPDRRLAARVAARIAW